MAQNHIFTSIHLFLHLLILAISINFINLFFDKINDHFWIWHTRARFSFYLDWIFLKLLFKEYDLFFNWNLLVAFYKLIYLNILLLNFIKICSFFFFSWFNLFS